MNKPAAGTKVPPPQAELRVRYYARMKPQRIYPLVVEVVQPTRGTPPPATVADTVLIRPIIAGAQVVPTYQRLQPYPGQQVTFHVTPLARGRLPAARVEVDQPGRPVRQMPLRIRTTSQRMTWALLALTLLIPPALLTFTRWAPLRGEVPQKMPKPEPAAGAADEEKKEPAKPVVADPMNPNADLAPPAREPEDKFLLLRDSPGSNLRYRLDLFRHMAERDVPNVPGITEERAAALTEQLGYAYDMLCELGDSYLSLWTGLVLLLATGGSWLMHRAYRRSRRETIELATRPVSNQSQETLPLAAEEQPLTVEPA